MQSQPTVPIFDIPPDKPEITSFGMRATNVFTAPTELFNELAAMPVQKSSWIIPFVISLIAAAFFVIAFFSQPVLRGQVVDEQRQEMERQVAEGKMRAEDMERAVSFMESSNMMSIFGAASAVVMVAAMTFCIPLVVWGAAKLAFKFQGGYSKILEIYGLTMMIGLFAGVLTMFLMNVFENIHATPSAALLVLDDFNPKSFMHQLLSSLNVMTLYQACIFGMGVAIVSRQKVLNGILLVLGLWLVWALGSSAWAVR